MTVSCLQCGECCAVPCAMAADFAVLVDPTWREGSGLPCPALLPPDAQGRRLCAVYDEIMTTQGDTPGDTFADGCCLSRGDDDG